MPCPAERATEASCTTKRRKMLLSSVTQSPWFSQQKLFIVLARGTEGSHPIHYRIKQPFKRRVHFEEVGEKGEKVVLNVCQLLC